MDPHTETKVVYLGVAICAVCLVVGIIAGFTYLCTVAYQHWKKNREV